VSLDSRLPLILGRQQLPAPDPPRPVEFPGPCPHQMVRAAASGFLVII